MCSVVSQKNLARKSLPCWLLPRNSPAERRMHCTRRGQKISSCFIWSTFGWLAGPGLIWPCMERGKPTLHLVSQLIHSLVSQLQRATPLVNIQSVLLARAQSPPQKWALLGWGERCHLLSSETLLHFCKYMPWKMWDFWIVCLFVLLLEKKHL